MGERSIYSRRPSLVELKSVSIVLLNNYYLPVERSTNSGLNMSPSYELPTTQKSTYLLDNHATKVKELLRWIRVCKFIAAGLIFAIGVNFVLMYGLIFHPPLPTAEKCMR